jgi:NADPH-dependent glutamate synthase beta subunit-like oxidoreductase/NAD(P)H-flavin reductase
VLKLPFGLAFCDLYTREGLVRLDQQFCKALHHRDSELAERLQYARQNFLEAKEESALILALAPILEQFIVTTFAIEPALHTIQATHDEATLLASCKRLFIQRYVAKRWSNEKAANLTTTHVTKELTTFLGEGWSLPVFAKQTLLWLEQKQEPELRAAETYTAWALYTPEGRHHHRHDSLFHLPQAIDSAPLLSLQERTLADKTVLEQAGGEAHLRDGFGCTEPAMRHDYAIGEAHYCIHCHPQGKDSCRTGLRDKEGAIVKNAQNVTLWGCPLEEKISEMNLLKSQGSVIGALAVAMIDNPLLAATGNRICNDCMKACIYQKQEPVDIPAIETRTLQDVLELPWGVEIYSLLSRWNPLHFNRPLPKPDTGRQILVVGMGPAGFNLTHHLLNDGHHVVGIDGLKIEPFAIDFYPIERWQDITETLDTRVPQGFGGVAEYGITVRWDKNYLTLIRLLLERRQQFALFGGVRLGSTVTIDDAWEMGFDHIALATGAGKPTLLDIPGAMARGVRAASDFLMALQSTGAALRTANTNLQLRLPAVVIGGGLTAVDTATEILAYYPLQVEKFLSRYEILVHRLGRKHVEAMWQEEEREIAAIFIDHAMQIRHERIQAATEKRPVNLIPLLQAWGGATILYRRTWQEAPSYRLNHEEVAKALEEGIWLLPEVVPVAIHCDNYGHANQVELEETGSKRRYPIAAYSILVAAGTIPNTHIAKESKGYIQIHNHYFRTKNTAGETTQPVKGNPKPKTPAVIAWQHADGRAISFFGDTHPSYAGNVVKAMASAKQGYPILSACLEIRTAPPAINVFKRCRTEWQATVDSVHRLTQNIVEVIVKAPAAAKHFQPGQFFRLQNYHAQAPATAINGTPTILAMEGLAMTGASVNVEQGLVSTIILEMGGSSSLCKLLRPGEPVVFMGPTGHPTPIPSAAKVLLIGGGLGNAVLFSIGKALRAKGSQVIYLAGYKTTQDRFHVAEIEAAADQVIWCCDHAILSINRPQDLSLHGSILEGLRHYVHDQKAIFAANEAKQMVVIGSDGMMAAVKQALTGELTSHFSPELTALASVNSPMQCMMKEICAQCIQRLVDPETGQESYVYTCANQDQCLTHVDFSHLQQRLQQNQLQEKLTSLWLEAAQGTLS